MTRAGFWLFTSFMILCMCTRASKPTETHVIDADGEVSLETSVEPSVLTRLDHQLEKLETGVYLVWFYHSSDPTQTQQLKALESIANNMADSTVSFGMLNCAEDEVAW